MYVLPFWSPTLVKNYQLIFTVGWPAHSGPELFNYDSYMNYSRCNISLMAILASRVCTSGMEQTTAATGHNCHVHMVATNKMRKEANSTTLTSCKRFPWNPLSGLYV